MKYTRRILFAACLALAGTACIVQAACAAADKPAAALSDKDRDFVKKAAIAGMAEVEQGKMAEQKAADAEVRKFAATMVADHGKANDKLKSLAQSRGWELPGAIDGAAKSTLDSLRAKSGAAFDQAYADGMRKDHDQAVHMFRDAAARADDADLRRFAKDTLPTLHHHKKMAYQLKPVKH
jgi:putative membrane protein